MKHNPYAPPQEPDSIAANYLEVRIESSTPDYIRIAADFRNDADPDRPWRQPDAIGRILVCGMKITAQADRTNPDWYAIHLRHDGTVQTATHARAIVAAFDRFDRQCAREYDQGLSHEHPAGALAAWMRAHHVTRWTVRDMRPTNLEHDARILAAGNLATLRELWRALDNAIHAHQHPQGWTAQDDADRTPPDTVADPRD